MAPRRLLTLPSLALALSLPLCPSAHLTAQDALDGVLRTVLDQASRDEVPFREVIRLTTGRSILPLNPSLEPDRSILDTVSAALQEALLQQNQPGSPARSVSRINEVSRPFEIALQQIIDRHPDFSCAPPLTASGAAQSSGYPDLMITHLPSNRITYLDPKLLQADSLSSSFRTFYFTPRTGTNKVLHDAHHLLAGIAHDGQTGAWTFTGWKLVDLHDFRVRLKAEYQAGNRDLYREDLILRSSESH